MEMPRELFAMLLCRGSRFWHSAAENPGTTVTEHEGHRLKSVTQLELERFVEFIGNWIKDGHIQGSSTEPDTLS